MSNEFQALTPEQRAKLDAFAQMLRQFNRSINLISRESEREIEQRHIRHVLTLASRSFPARCRVVDWGTGGGLPAIPLAICFPEVQFHAVDAVGKKINAVQAMARRLGLTNLEAWHGRAETWPGRAEYSVSRATAPLVDLWGWHIRVAYPLSSPAGVEVWQPGLICLKGGDLRAEIAELQSHYPDVMVQTTDVGDLLDGEDYEEKVVVEVYTSAG